MNCPECDSIIEDCVAGSYGLLIGHCHCGWGGVVTEPTSPRIQQFKLPHLDRGKQAVNVRMSEKTLQAAIVKVLRLTGHIVLVTGAARRKVGCPQCSHWFFPTGWMGNAPGTPDLLVSHPDWNTGAWKGLEVKGHGTRVTDEQKALADAGRIIIVRSVEEALEAVRA